MLQGRLLPGQLEVINGETTTMVTGPSRATEYAIVTP
jgi:hypothetical protein